MTVFWVRQNGTIFCATADEDPPPGPGLKKVTTAPPTGGRDIWDGTKWIAAAPEIDPDSALDLAIDGAANLTALKAVLKGRIKARPI